jgi:glycerol dehydrogenase
LREIDSHVAQLRSTGVDALIAVGGGKCVDTGKAIADRLGVPIVVVPTLASNDAPCSALSVLYDPDGTATDVEFYPNGPALVVVDTAVVAAAPERFLVAGMGDAMATWYEADVTLANPNGRSSIGGRPSIASAAIGRACAQTLYEHGITAAAAVRAGTVDNALEDVVEANTLLSGLGFESGGLAAAHGIAQSCTGIEEVHAGYLHGEMVAFGLITQLAMEDRPDEATRVAEFFCAIGLPVHLGHLSIAPSDSAALDVITSGTIGFPMIGNMPMHVDEHIVLSALTTAHGIGRDAVGSFGDDAYRRLHQ